eukprot:COSAG02_NODE_4856_length_4899_cov_2.376667_3_plen_85_part_00
MGLATWHRLVLHDYSAFVDSDTSVDCSKNAHTAECNIIVWNRANEAHVGPELKGKADAAIAAEREKAKAVLKKAGGIKGWLASL